MTLPYNTLARVTLRQLDGDGRLLQEDIRTFVVGEDLPANQSTDRLKIVRTEVIR